MTMHTSIDAVFSTYMRQYSPLASRLALRMLHDGDEADDIVQEAFTRLYLDGASMEADAFRNELLYRVRRLVRNKRAREQRVEARRNAWAREIRRDSPAIDEAESMELSRLDASFIERALSGLSPVQRRCFESIALAGRPSEEVARECGISGVTAREHVRRARRALATVL